MKKLLTLMIMLGLFAMPSITTQAYSIDANDIPITQLNGLTLNEVFRDGQIITNADFSNGTTDWLGFLATFTDSNNELTATATGSFPSVYQFITITTGNIFYLNVETKAISGDSDLILIFDNVNLSFQSNPVLNQYYFLSGIRTTTSASPVGFEVAYRSSTLVGEQYAFKNPKAYNLTNLGLTLLTKSQLDYWFNQWQINNAYIEAFNADAYEIGYENGYNQGYDDAVQEDNAYALGYAFGLSQGEDMETGSSILIFVVAAIGFIMMIFGFTTKRGIFNLLSVGAFVVLGAMLAQYIGFIIIAIGLVLINVYYAFWGDL